MRKYILEAPVDLMSKDEILKSISDLIKTGGRMKLVVTAYSEFYVRAQKDELFMKAMKSADLITADGVSVLAAARYLDEVKGMPVVKRFVKGIQMGGEILNGKVGKPVTGVWLFEELTKMAAKNGWRVFLLGGWNNVSGRTSRRLLKRFPDLKVEYDSGEERVGTDEKTNTRVIEKINKFAPDLLFVSYNPIKQEKWLDKHRDVLKAKVGVGIGGTFDEYVGDFKKAPLFMERMGLKWLWRVIVEPKRMGRILRAVIVFPWLVFRSSR